MLGARARQLPFDFCLRNQIPYLHHSSTIVGDGLLAVAVNKQEVTTVWAQGALDCGLHGNTCVDVGDNLTLALRSVGACMSKRQ